MRSERAFYAVTTRKSRGSAHVEVLLHRRPDTLSLMPGMVELPHLRDAPTAGTPEPLLRVRHAIVGTNFYVEVFSLADRAAVRRLLRPGSGDLLWVRTANLRREPLTGLARKVLQRLGLMPAALAETANASLPLLIGRHNRVGLDEGNTAAHAAPPTPRKSLGSAAQKAPAVRKTSAKKAAKRPPRSRIQQP